MRENHRGWMLIKGVRQDVVNLFKLFVNANSVRYEDFCKVWKESKFSLIFRNRIIFIELLEFTEELLHIVKEYISSPYEFHTRVAALYTLYGLYFKQPLREAAKIRFTRSEWEDIHNFISHCKEGKHYDIVFIYLKLYLSGAFTFTATPRTSGLETGFRKYSEKRYIPTNDCDVELLYRPLVSEKLLNSLVKLESLYCKKKAELLGKKNIDFIDGKFAKTLQKELTNYAAESQKAKTSDEVKSSNSDSTQNKDKNDGENSISLKTKSYKRKKNDELEKNPTKKTQRKIIGSKYLELLAKKKAEFYIKKLQEENGENSESARSNFDLPELDVT